MEHCINSRRRGGLGGDSPPETVMNIHIIINHTVLFCDPFQHIIPRFPKSTHVAERVACLTYMEWISNPLHIRGMDTGHSMKWTPANYLKVNEVNAGVHFTARGPVSKSNTYLFTSQNALSVHVHVHFIILSHLKALNMNHLVSHLRWLTSARARPLQKGFNWIQSWKSSNCEIQSWIQSWI